jgi:hypothetical protein
VTRGGPGYTVNLSEGHRRTKDEFLQRDDRDIVRTEEVVKGRGAVVTAGKVCCTISEIGFTVENGFCTGQSVLET